ncbi:citrate lyase acyl carrier protein [Streptococcus porcinus]
MEIKKVAIAGTLESSDVQVIVEPHDTLQVSIESSVMNQYGLAIQKTVYEVLERLGVTSGKLIMVDKGALDCTIKARIQTAIYRSNDLSKGNIPWGKL